MKDVRQHKRLLLVLGLLLIPALALPFSWLRAQPLRPVAGPAAAPTTEEVLRFTRNIPGDTKPIQLAADEIHAWNEGNDQVFLMRGQVLIQHGVFLMRAQQAVAFVDMAAYKARGIWRAEVFAEGSIQFDNSSENKQANRAVIELHTRGEIKVHSGKARLNPQPQANDPLVLTGRGQRKPFELPRLTGTAPAAAPAKPVPYVAPGIGSGSADGSLQQNLLPGSLPSGGALPPLLPGPGQAPLPERRPGGAGGTDPYLPPGAGTGPGALAPLPPAGNVVPPPAPRPTPPSPPPSNSVGGPPLGAGGEEQEALATRNRNEQPAPATEQAVSAPGIVPPGSGALEGATVVVAQQPIAPPPIAPPPTVAGPPRPPALTVGDLPDRRLAISPRSSTGFGLARELLPTGEQALVVTGGVILNIRGAPKVDIVDLEADRLVIISKKVDPQELFNGMREPQGGKQQPDVEFYLAGNVEIRQPGPREDTRTIRADEVYYDVKRSVAVALRGSIEIRDPKIDSPIIARAEEILQTSTTTFEVIRAEFFASKLPSDPGLKVFVSEAKVEERKFPRMGLFGQMVDRKTGRPMEQSQTWVTARDVWFELEGIPIFYTPYLAGDLRDPLGPVEDIRVGYNQIFGFQAGLTLDIYELLGVQPFDGTRWTFLFDGITERGAGLGTNFTYKNRDLFGIPSEYEGFFRGYGLFDHGVDNLGGFRIIDREPVDYRARLTWQHGWYDLPNGFQLQSQVSYLTDRNYLEQYFQREFSLGVPQETFVYLKQQQENAAWSIYANYRLREWVTETESLPNLEGHLLGQTFFDWIVYNSNASVGYFRLRTSSDPLPNINPVTDVTSESGRLDWWQEVAVPLDLGAFKVVPYLRLDLTGYTEDLNGESTGRILGGGGLRTSLPLSRLDADVQSDLFNLNGLHHKMVFSTNWYYAQANDSFDQFAQFDRVNLDVSDQQVKEIRNQYPTLLGPTTAAILSSELYDPQRMAIRRLIDTRVDTRDDINVVQLQWSNRWQTKRGFPGAQHIMDWMSLDVSASFFPQKDRDNFGSYFAFVEYDWAWNIGDRTALVSSGWIDPIDDGVRIFNFGSFYNRPDGSSFYLGYRHIDPLESRAIIASATYTFSPKYSGTASIMYDFGSERETLSQTLLFNRVGTDLTMSLGVNYNSLQNTFGLVFQLVPNLINRGNFNLAGLGTNGIGR